MSESLPKAVLDSADITAICQLILREREGRDLARWDQMRACFFADSQVRISWFQGSGADFVAGSMEMMKRGLVARHRLSPILVTLAGDRAIGSLNGIIDAPAKIRDVDATLSAHARFLYRVERRGWNWGIVGLDVIYVRDELTPMIPGQSITIDPKAVEAFRPSYRLLSYVMSLRGYTVDQNLPGEDRPELVEARTKEIQKWLKESG